MPLSGPDSSICWLKGSPAAKRHTTSAGKATPSEARACCQSKVRLCCCSCLVESANSACSRQHRQARSLDRQKASTQLGGRVASQPASQPGQAGSIGKFPPKSERGRWCSSTPGVCMGGSVCRCALLLPHGESSKYAVSLIQTNQTTKPRGKIPTQCRPQQPTLGRDSARPLASRVGETLKLKCVDQPNLPKSSSASCTLSSPSENLRRVRGPGMKDSLHIRVNCRSEKSSVVRVPE